MGEMEAVVIECSACLGDRRWVDKCHECGGSGTWEVQRRKLTHKIARFWAYADDEWCWMEVEDDGEEVHTTSGHVLLICAEYSRRYVAYSFDGETVFKAIQGDGARSNYEECPVAELFSVEPNAHLAEALPPGTKLPNWVKS